MTTTSNRLTTPSAGYPLSVSHRACPSRNSVITSTSFVARSICAFPVGTPASFTRTDTFKPLPAGLIFHRRTLDQSHTSVDERRWVDGLCPIRTSVRRPLTRTDRLASANDNDSMLDMLKPSPEPTSRFLEPRDNRHAVGHAPLEELISPSSMKAGYHRASRL
jgi:hypothetical protein